MANLLKKILSFATPDSLLHSKEDCENKQTGNKNDFRILATNTEVSRIILVSTLKILV